MLPFTEKVIQVIKKIPEGKVMTYGQIAKLSGHPKAARQVARILHSMSKKHHLPWHRVINAKGQIAIQDEATYYEQMMSLQAEGVEVDASGRVDLEKYRVNWQSDYIDLD
ncbi:MGMT family protein [Oceanobacillus luteolus]|uniref:MGMT family protein n=1 Tax=Oceanobacillus luteolus TaxID=1274358 RepID=A0ABW4HN08_9BACI|nr:MGMT family protein [Oceanobacillus luteolus]MCM3740542.1 MGMT family protein [Oceanobacillus luteolus]